MRTTTKCRTAGAVTAAAIIMASWAAVTPAPAYADCGDPDQPACTGPVPSSDQVVAVMTELTDPGKPAAAKTDIVTPGFAPEETGTIDDHLNRLNARGYMPFNFVVTDIEPAPNNFAGATVAAPSVPHYSVPAVPIVLVSRGGYWLLTHDAAMVFLNKMWSSTRPRVGFAL